MSAKDYQKDYYKTLGVPKTATAAEIKKAYRELARKYHPDANKGSTDAEERFKEITEAYNVVSDEKQRKEYDEARSMFGGFRVPAGSRPGAGAGAGNFDFGDLFGGEGLGDVIGGIFRGSRPGGGGAASRARRGADVETETNLSFGDAIDGATVSLRLTGEGSCPVCHGTGAKTGTVPKVCPDCHGTGQQSRNLGGFGLSEPCKTCRGRGLVVEDPCPSCSGSGRAMSSRTIQARIPAGVADGQRIRIPGKGAPGEHGGKAGDLYVRVHVTPHAVFGRNGRQPHGDGAGDDARACARRGDQGADAPGRRRHRARPPGHAERTGAPRPRPRRPPQGRDARRAARHRRGGRAAGPEQEGAVGARGPAHRHGGG